MARQTRAQRRARRERDGAAQAPAVARAPARPVPAPAAPQARTQRRFGFVRESWGELQKVEWPRQQQLIQGVVVVLVACLVVGVYLYGADLVFKRLVENVFLR